MLNRTDPGEVVRNVECMLSCVFKLLQELNGPAILFVEVPPLQRHHRRVDTNNHDLGLMEVPRVFVFRISLLLRPPAGVFQSSSSTTRSTSSTYCCELVDRPEWRFRNVARVRWLVSSLSSGTTSSRPYQQLLGQFWSHFVNPRSQLEGRKSEVGKVVGLGVGVKSE